MNYVLITVGLIFFICFIVGIYRGAVRIAVSLAAALLTLAIVAFATPYVSQIIVKATPMDEMIKDKVTSVMVNAAQSKLLDALGENDASENDMKDYFDAAGISEENLDDYGISAEDIPRDLQQSVIREADLPDVFKNLLETNNNEVVYEELGVKTFAEYAGSFLAKLIINIVAFLCTFLIVTIILRAVIFALDIIAELPGLGFLNHLAGGAIGVAGALIIVWFLFVLVTLLYTTGLGREVYEAIQTEQILKMIYDYNPLMKLATKI